MQKSRQTNQRVGIDLGTTYSSLGCLGSNDKPTPIADFEGDFATPSAVFFPQGEKHPIVGRRALERGAEHPHRLVTHAKRYLGSADVEWEIDGVVYTPVDISAIILRKLIRDAEREIGDIRQAVITVPAHFSGYQRQLTIQAGNQAGLEKVSVVNEPVAAAMAYALADFVLGDAATILMDHLDEKSTILVYDLGGGTFDLSIVEYDKTKLQAIATSGEQRLGGIDWDQHLIDLIAEPLAIMRGDVRKDPHALRKLAHALERAKRALSNVDETIVEIAHNGWEEEFVISRSKFEEITSPLVEHTRQLTNQLLERCNLKWSDIDALVPVGGATRMPMIQALLESFAQERRINDNFIRKVSPDLSVAAGAALFAGIISAGEKGSETAGHLSRTLAAYRAQSVSAQALGILVRDGDGRRSRHMLIPKNTALPATTKIAVSTTRTNQKRASVRVIEGELDQQNGAVCKCTIDDLPAGLPKGSIIDVDLTYDVDGLLHVIAMHRDTGRSATISTQFSAVS